MEQCFGFVVCSLTTKLCIASISLFALLAPCSSIQPNVDATSPVQHVVENGILSLHCEFSNLGDSNTVIISRILQGKTPERLSWGTDLRQEIDERIFLAVRQFDGGKFVYFLTIMEATQHDSGVYVCQILREADLVPIEISRASVTIDIMYFPKTIECSPEDAAVAHADDLITLNCTTGDSNPSVSIQWIRTGSRETISPSRTGHHTDGRVYSELSFRPTIEDNGAVFLCEVFNPIFPEERLSCHVRLSLLPNPDKQDPVDNENIPDQHDLVTVVNSVTDFKDVNDISRISRNCEKSCSTFTTPTIYWIIATAVASLFAFLFLVMGLILIFKLCMMPPPELSDVFYSPHPNDDIYAQLEGRVEGNRVYMTLEKPRAAANKSGDIDRNRNEGQYLVPVLGPQL